MNEYLPKWKERGIFVVNASPLGKSIITGCETFQNTQWSRNIYFIFFITALVMISIIDGFLVFAFPYVDSVDTLVVEL